MSTSGAWLFLGASISHIRMFLQFCLHPFEGIFFRPVSGPECTSDITPCFKVDGSIRPKGGHLSCKTYDGKKGKIPCRIKNKNKNLCDILCVSETPLAVRYLFIFCHAILVLSLLQ